MTAISETAERPDERPTTEASAQKETPAQHDNLSSIPPPTKEGSIDDPMLEYFVGRLEVRLRRIEPGIKRENDPDKLSALGNFTSAFEEFRKADWPDQSDQAWNRAYRLERLLALAEPRENLWPELLRRLAQAEDEGVRATKRLEVAKDAIAARVLDPKETGVVQQSGEAIVRSLLLETLEETHRSVQRKFISRPIRKKATTRIVVFGMCAFALFMVPYFVLYHKLLHGQEQIAQWAWLPLYSVATTGLFGALFSRLLYLQSNWNALTVGGLRDSHEIASILLRASVGMIGAVIVFFFLRSGIISGGLFPDFREIGVEELESSIKAPNVESFRLYFPTKSWALLVVWSFLAGFSERLLPSILQDTESTLGTSKAPK